MSRASTILNANLPLALVVAAVLCIAAALEFGAEDIFGLDVPAGAGVYGRVDSGPAASAYPREARDAHGYTVTLARPARRVASLYWSIDEFVYSIAPPETIVTVTQSAYDHQISNVYSWAETFQPTVAGSVEALLRVNPDLVLASSERSADFVDIVRAAGAPVFQMFMMFTTLDEVAENILLTGYLTGRDEKAQEVYEAFRSAVRRARTRKPADAPAPRILGFAGRYSYGDQTLFHDMVQTVGGVNVGAENGLRGYDAISTERVLRWNPDWIVAGAGRGQTRAVLERIMTDPAIALTAAAAKGQILVFEHNLFLPMSPYTMVMLDALSEALYGNSSKGTD